MSKGLQAASLTSGRRPTEIVAADRKVGMGQIEVGQRGHVLKTLLGSCVGLTLHDRRAGVGGLAHIVLPDSRGDLTAPGKFADTALPELLRLINELGGRTEKLIAKLAGAANMFSSEAGKLVGEQNLLAVEALLASRRIPIVGRHCGGTQGRRMAFYIETGEVTIDILGSESVVL
ncbi:MAG TPA: chemotaxis protein CheD [Planctomycetaceae bacterium]|nr:chemotaxis protein CheD [Planctomycetaceae bacterium]